MFIFPRRDLSIAFHRRIVRLFFVYANVPVVENSGLEIRARVCDVFSCVLIHTNRYGKSVATKYQVPGKTTIAVSIPAHDSRAASHHAFSFGAR